MTDHASPSLDPVVDARRREMAVEHLLFGTIQFLARKHPELLDDLDGSLGHLWDKSEGEARDDEAVREIARKFIRSLRAEE
ncbi:hypothetical protein [Methylobacterium aerolatum]|uniref:Uncharacterized protein n=1 Tax=Methylobacterium aerolatum TaxID=418708 RepID=A0ABU0I5G0_9HYPH|nr:hypothetical protein [Methylobacterium aerolatum]MDQ0449856.1 hypothetical protein [Methylobacterium aerolatum]GJD36623.1 hypothetical protein FMGBMHLM_3546 [Methylobacterium aerolatum]